MIVPTRGLTHGAWANLHRRLTDGRRTEKQQRGVGLCRQRVSLQGAGRGVLGSSPLWGSSQAVSALGEASEAPPREGEQVPKVAFLKDEQDAASGFQNLNAVVRRHWTDPDGGIQFCECPSQETPGHWRTVSLKGDEKDKRTECNLWF